MKPEKEKLIDDLLAGQSRREATLRVSAQILRRRRHGRMARQALTLLALVAVAAIFIVEQNNRPQKTPSISIAEIKPAPSQTEILTDKQLLALFPNTPVGLVTLPNGKKVLIFPRPADEARYVVHL